MIDSKAIAEKIRKRIEENFSPSILEIADQSHLHKGHRQSGGGGHFLLKIQSKKFNGLSPLARQRLVLSLFSDMMDKDIHALSFQCLPE
ncbi:MAG: BolA family transcriptional regulator [Oligoflexia bacterium]|nr:BolA family transcriptional regulator [Oligoflexia bacterium]